MMVNISSIFHGFIIGFTVYISIIILVFFREGEFSFFDLSATIGFVTGFSVKLFIDYRGEKLKK